MTRPTPSSVSESTAIDAVGSEPLDVLVVPSVDQQADSTTTKLQPEPVDAGSFYAGTYLLPARHEERGNEC